MFDNTIPMLEFQKRAYDIDKIGLKNYRTRWFTNDLFSANHLWDPKSLVESNGR